VTILEELRGFVQDLNYHCTFYEGIGCGVALTIVGIVAFVVLLVVT